MKVFHWLLLFEGPRKTIFALLSGTKCLVSATVGNLFSGLSRENVTKSGIQYFIIDLGNGCVPGSKKYFATNSELYFVSQV
jgi:hypothetical protein